VFNDGPETAQGVNASVYLPDDARFVSASRGCGFDESNHSVTCQISRIRNGQRRTRTIRLRLPGGVQQIDAEV
ncbi:hypothetical protein QQ73_09310, partial [Candidatus Endoriftia persephone str. Guaymas]|nr:hypothetical protein [Candidatus Endoriftia persephone str. Guaymas]